MSFECATVVGGQRGAVLANPDSRSSPLRVSLLAYNAIGRFHRSAAVEDGTNLTIENQGEYEEVLSQ